MRRQSFQNGLGLNRAYKNPDRAANASSGLSLFHLPRRLLFPPFWTPANAFKMSLEYEKDPKELEAGVKVVSDSETKSSTGDAGSEKVLSVWQKTSEFLKHYGVEVHGCVWNRLSSCMRAHAPV